MDKLNQYRRLVMELMQEQADLMKSQPVPGEEVDCVFDTERDHYLLLRYGWTRGKFTHYTKLHVRLSDGKIRIEEDMTEEGFATELATSGVDWKDIILAFNTPLQQTKPEMASV